MESCLLSSVNFVDQTVNASLVGTTADRNCPSQSPHPPQLLPMQSNLTQRNVSRLSYPDAHMTERAGNERTGGCWDFDPGPAPGFSRLCDSLLVVDTTAVVSLTEEFNKLEKTKMRPLTHPETEEKPADVSGGPFLI